MSSEHQSKRSRKRHTKRNDLPKLKQKQTQTQKQPAKTKATSRSTKKGSNHSLIIISICIAIIAVFISSFYCSSKATSTVTPSTHSTSSSKNSSRKRKITRHGRILISLDKDEILLDETRKWNTSDPELLQTFDFLSNYVCAEANRDHNHDDDDKQMSGNTYTGTNTDTNTDINLSSSYCHPLIQPAPQRRTHYVAKVKAKEKPKSKSNKGSIRMRQGDIVMVLPRHLLVWDLDAMRNREFVQRELFHAKHETTGNSLDSGAFLASFLVYRQKLIQGTWKWKWNGSNNKDAHDQDQSESESEAREHLNRDARLLDYLNILPQYSKLSNTHPVLWPEETIKDLFGKFTITFQLVNAYKNMVKSEYHAFCKVSSLFKTNIHEKEYTAMRINVMSRSFGPGPPSKLEEVRASTSASTDDSFITLEDELELYQNVAGVNLTKGCRAMSPILDMWDHHAKPNVKWIYSREEKAFVVTVFEKEIPPWNDIMVSYGTYTDSHLFAKFGFVNGDGSGHTEISIATMHQLLDVGLGQQYSYMKYNSNNSLERIQRQTQTPLSSDKENQRKNLLQYLISDDGYKECIEKERNPKGYELKLLKYRLLQAIANKRERWIVKFQPRDEESKPAANSYIPIQTDPPKFDPRNVKFDGSKIIPTCRLLALTNEDYDGRALEVLKDVFESGKIDSFQVNKQTDELEYRALIWLARLTNIALKKYPTTVREDMERLASSEVPFRSKEWNALQVRLGEMQSLESLRSIASSGTRHMMERVKRQGKNVNAPQMHIRQKVCKFDYTAELLKEKKL